MRKWLPLLVLNFCFLAAANWLVAGAAPARQNTTPTPPPPTWTPGPPQPKTPVPVSEAEPAGSAIELHVRLTSAWWPKWQQVWTVVQWQDAWGDWHDVEGWRGTLDEIVSTEGIKTWWVYRQDLGKGPFRWLIYDRAGGQWLATSRSFNLPSASEQTVQVTVELGR